MRRIIPLLVAVTAATVVSSLITAREFAQARPAVDSTAYGVVDPNKGGRGNPGFVFQHNMGSVRRVGTGRYCLRASVRFDEGPIAVTSVDGILPSGGFAVAVSDLNARYCDRSNEEAAVATFIIVNGHARPSNSIRFVGDSIG